MVTKADLIEPLDVREPPGHATGKVAELWRPVEGTNKIVCTACARYCKIGDGQVGLCGVRGVHEGKLWLYVYGRVITGHVDPIEKKPVMHYRPGSKIFSVATTGCNWLCRYCFLPGTLVLTDKGHVPIESIFARGETTDNPEARVVPHTQVLTHTGQWRAVRKAFEHLHSGRVLHVRPYYLPGFECTPDHGVYASIGGGVVRKVNAEDLKIGDFLAVPKPNPSGTNTVDVEALLQSQIPPAYKRRARIETEHGRVRWSSERNAGIPAQLRLTPNIARLFGYYCAEGSVNWHPKRANSGTVWFSFGSHEEARLREVERALSSAFGLQPRRIRQESRTAVVVSSASLATLFKSLCGSSSADKRVPTPILQSTESTVIRGFLTGYFNGDGYVTKRKGGMVLGSSSISSAMTYGVAHLLIALGDIPRVYLAKNAPTYEIQGRVVNRANDHMLRLWVDEVTLDPEEASWRASKVRVLETESHYLLPIRSITEREYIGPVYNIEVEEDHSYTANLMAVANCQNFDISQRRKVEGIDVEPEDVVKMTLEQGCQGLAYTYNQPTIFIEFARDIGMAARKAGLMNIFVSNGYDTPEAVAEMPKFLDCITVDFKGSGETKFVQRYIGIPNADPIFDTIQRVRDTKATHIEITDLIVPQVGDDLEAARKLSKFVYDELGPDTPIHFLRFHPDYKMNEFPWTPVETLEKHCAVAKEAGLKYVYIGNVQGHELEHTYCPGCGAIAIRRYGFDITGWYLDRHNRCKKCGYTIPIVGALEKTFKDDRFYSVLYHR